MLPESKVGLITLILALFQLSEMCYLSPPPQNDSWIITSLLTERQLIPTHQNIHASHSQLYLISHYSCCSCLVWQVAILFSLSLSLSPMMSLTNDTLIYSLPYFRGPGVSLLMHLGWRASPPGPGHCSHLGVRPTITHAICTNCSICVWIWNAIPEYDWRPCRSPKRAVRMRGIFYSSVRLPLHLVYVISCKGSLWSFTFKKLYRKWKSNGWCQIVIVQWISIRLKQVIER